MNAIVLIASILLNAGHPVEVLDLGPACEGGYPEVSVLSVRPNSKGSAPILRLSYSTHPDGLGPRGDFWRETSARYLGDDVDLPILPANINRFDLFTLTRTGDFRSPLLQGLVRYVRLALEDPESGGSIELKDFRLVNDKVHSVGERTGSFSCSDVGLTRIWEAAARTCELSAIPSYEARHVSPPVTTLPYLADGAKRDRLVWSGDLWWAERNMFYAFVTNEPYMKGSIRLLATNRTPDGYVQACPWPEQKPPKLGEYGPFPSDEFAAWFVPVLWEYHLYRDDLPLLTETWSVTRDLVAYLKRHVRADGIFEQRPETSKHAAGLVFGGTSCHHRSYMNIVLWMTYRDAAKIATALGHSAEAETWRADAVRLAGAIRSLFWNQEKGFFVLSAEDRSMGQEANALALASGFATPTEAARIMPQIVRIRHGKFQAIAVRGKFMYGDAKGALALIAAHNWYKLVDPDWKGAHLTSECTHLIRKGWGDEAHPDTAIAGILSAYVLGIEPLEPGFRKFRFSPPTNCDLTSASGRIPTPHGEIVASWKRTADGQIVKSLTCPPGTACIEPSQYLDVMSTAVSAYSPERIDDFVSRVEKRGIWEHGFPRLTANLGVLVARGICPEKRDLVRRLMDLCAREMPRALARGNKSAGNDFAIKEIVCCLQELKKAGTFPKDIMDSWRAAFTTPTARSLYSCQPEVGAKEAHNWCVFGAASEQARLAAGLGGDPDYVERYVSDQLRFFDENGMYRDPHNPMVYDAVTRLQFAALLYWGYHGPSYERLMNQMLKSAEPTLKMISATGEIPYGGRSNQFLHNEMFYAALCEWYARLFKSRGDLRMASRFRAAASRAVDSFDSWTSGPVIHHVKNEYPTSTGYGCENYAYFDKYMVTAGSWAYLAELFADPTIPCAAERPWEGTFVTSPAFHRVLLGRGDYTAEFDWDGQKGYDASGFGRLVRRGAPPPICLSTPCPVKPHYKLDVTNDVPFAIAPVGWSRYDIAAVDASSLTLTNQTSVLKGTLEPDGLTVDLVGTGKQTLMLPAFLFDGAERTVVSAQNNVLKIAFRDWMCAYTVRAGKLKSTPKVYANRNGHYLRYEACGLNHVVVHIAIEPIH